MAITKRQFTQLQAMGIELWQLKNRANEVTSSEYLNIEFSAISKTKIFTDIIHSLDLSIGEILCADNTLSLGLLTWQFSEKSEISLTKHHLITPTIAVLKNSPPLKKALWEKLKEHSKI